jgi:UDP-N-acetyl-D-mannosaminuronic acid dehydrogenase
MLSNADAGTEYHVVIIGGLGHVGLPLGITFAKEGLRVCLYDLNDRSAEIVKNGNMPFIEYGAETILREVLDNGNLTISKNIKDVLRSQYVVIAIGTPVDEYLNPKTRQFLDEFKKIAQYITDKQTVIVRSSVYPNTCTQMSHLIKDKKIHIAYCPERIVQGYAVKELKELPQIVAGLTDEATEKAAELFGIISPKIIRTSMKEAELTKLFSNAWRYIQFAVANQFYMICDKFEADYDRVRYAMMEGYGRAANLPTAGLAAGPCLLKDTMQLASFNSNNFLLGHAAMMVNEGLPNFIVDNLRKKYDITERKVGILGMAFKADIDDIRDSLSYKLGKILRFHGADVYYSDEYAKDPTFIPKENLISLCDIVIIGVPHSQYKNLEIPDSKEVVDLWNIVKRAS